MGGALNINITAQYCEHKVLTALLERPIKVSVLLEKKDFHQTSYDGSASITQ